MRLRLADYLKREQAQDDKQTTMKLVGLGLVTFILMLVAVPVLPDGIDWRQTYRPAALALVEGKSPFEEVEIYFSAPWALIPFIPLALLPEDVGRSILFFVSIGAFALIAHRMGATPLTMTAFLISPPVMHCLLNGNIEWLPLLGVLMPPPIGIFFIAIKPQIGIGVGIFWLIDVWRRDGIRAVVRDFAPFTIILLISFALFGVWILRFQETITLTQSYNASLFPSTIPVGLALLATAFRTRNLRWSMAASPCLSPYVLLHAWSGALAAVLPLRFETIAAVVGLWIVVIIRAGILPI